MSVLSIAIVMYMDLKQDLSLSIAGGSDVYAVLVCGNDTFSPKAAAIFKRDLLGLKSVLTDNRIVGLR